jgi:hypothetical protein
MAFRAAEDRSSYEGLGWRCSPPKEAWEKLSWTGEMWEDESEQAISESQCK